jgi:hypothetical protein
MRHAPLVIGNISQNDHHREGASHKYRVIPVLGRYLANRRLYMYT